MNKGNAVKLIMTQPLSVGQMLDEKVYVCELVSYDRQQEMVFLILNEGELKELSLDAIYECHIFAEEAMCQCTGRIVERFHDAEGKKVNLRVKNGFYKINIK